MFPSLISQNLALPFLNLEHWESDLYHTGAEVFKIKVAFQVKLMSSMFQYTRLQQLSGKFQLYLSSPSISHHFFLVISVSNLLDVFLAIAVFDLNGFIL